MIELGKKLRLRASFAIYEAQCTIARLIQEKDFPPHLSPLYGTLRRMHHKKQLIADSYFPPLTETQLLYETEYEKRAREFKERLRHDLFPRFIARLYVCDAYTFAESLKEDPDFTVREYETNAHLEPIGEPIFRNIGEELDNYAAAQRVTWVNVDIRGEYTGLSARTQAVELAEIMRKLEQFHREFFGLEVRMGIIDQPPYAYLLDTAWCEFKGTFYFKASDVS